MTKHVPSGYSAVTPYLVLEDLDQLARFCGTVFGAEVTESVAADDGSPRHVELSVGGRVVVMAGRAPQGAGTTPAMLYVYVPDCDRAYERALRAGAASISPPTDQFYGDRTAGVRDAQGCQWFLAQRFEDLSGDALQERARGG